MATIAVTGGGSGGHITPVLAVAQELKKLEPTTRVIYISQTGDSLGDIPRKDSNIDQVFTVRAGKFRRYHGEGWRQVLDGATMAKNLRDAWFVFVGIGQSYRLLKKTRPDIIFTRGSFVSVPVALAAAWLKIPYVTHDTDAIPSLANRLIARWALLHAVALPKEVYPYPAYKTVTVGVPISTQYHLSTPQETTAIRKRLGFGPDQKIILLTGGGHGSLLLNEALVAIAGELLDRYPDLEIIQLTGRDHADQISNKYNDMLTAKQRSRLHVEGYVNNLYDCTTIADVVIARAGGTTIAEFAAQAKACIIIPNPILTGGHQTKNGDLLAKGEAVILITESELAAKEQPLLQALARLLDHPEEAAVLGQKLHALAQPDAARKLAVLLLKQASYK